MTTLTVRKHTFAFKPVSDSHNRRATKFQNNIFASLKKIGLTPDDVNCEVERFAMKQAPASATWYFQGQRLYYSYSGQDRFVDNLFVVSKIIELEVEQLLSEEKTLEEFITGFSEDEDVEDQRIKARELLGVDKDSKDLSEINKNYKLLAKKHHPDMDGGDHETFQALNKAHKLLKRELE